VANTAYNYYKAQNALGNTPWGGVTWRAVLVSAFYTPNFTTDQTVSAFAGDIVGTATAMSGNAVSAAGVLSANSVTFTGVTSGLTVKYIIVYYDTGSATFLAFCDDTGTGLPYTTTGGNVLVNWSGTSVSGIIYSF